MLYSMTITKQLFAWHLQLNLQRDVFNQPCVVICRRRKRKRSFLAETGFLIQERRVQKMTGAEKVSKYEPSVKLFLNIFQNEFLSSRKLGRRVSGLICVLSQSEKSFVKVLSYWSFTFHCLSFGCDLAVATKGKGTKADSHVSVKRTPSNSSSSEWISNFLFPFAKH